MQFEKPSQNEIKKFINGKINIFDHEALVWNEIFEVTENLSLGDISKAFDMAAKESILFNNNYFTNKNFISSLLRRKK